MATRPAVRPATAPDLRVIPGRRRIRTGLPQLVLLSAIAIAMFFGLIYSRVFLDRTAFRLTDLEQQISQEEARYQELRLAVAQLQAPGRIHQEAQEMGLVLPSVSGTVRAATGSQASELDGQELKLLLSVSPRS